MNKLSFKDLSSEEKEELALCGITTDEQLQQCTAEAIRHDVEQLRRFFPDRTPVLTEERIVEIFSTDTDESLDNRIPDEEFVSPAAQFTHKKNLREELIRERTGTGAARHQKGEFRHLSPAEKLERMHGLSKHFHAIRCSHPMRVYFGAWATLLLIIPFFALLAIPTMLLTGDIDSGKPLYYGLAFAALVLPWFLIARRAQCGVCHIPLYRFGNYPHNRNAHHLPLLGYTLTTALHIIFLFWFRCPACGTMMKLSSNKHHHHH